MGKFDGILLVTDFDGTVAVGAKISQGNAEAIRYFQEEGGIYTLCSGRIEKGITELMAPVVPNAPCILVNGTLIYDTKQNECLYRAPCGRELWDFCEEMYDTFPEDVDGLRMYPVGEGINVDRAKGGITQSLWEMYDRPILKGIIHVAADSSDRMLEAIRDKARGRFSVSRSWPRGIEVQALGCDKGAAVLRLRKLLGERVKLLVTAGDYENDVSLLEVADIGYAVGNAQPAVKAVASRITVPCAEDAVARIIADLEKDVQTLA